MADYTIINADVGNNSGEIKAVKFNTEDVLKLTFNYDDNSAIWEKYIPEDLYIIGVDGNKLVRWKESSTNLNTQELSFSMLIKSPNAGDPENDKNTINIVPTYYSLYPSYSIIDNFGYILNNPFDTKGTLTLNNKTYNYSPSESARNIQYLFNHEFTSKIVKVPWQTGNEGISYIQDSDNNIKVIQTLVYYPQDFISVDNISDFSLFLFDYETGTRSESITKYNISEKTSGFITDYEYEVNTTVIDEETTDVYPTLTLTFTCTKNNTGKYRDVFFIVGKTTFNASYSGLHIIQEPHLLYSTRGYTYSGSVYYLNEYYSEMLDNFNNRLPSSPNYLLKADYYSDNHGITDFSGLFSIGHVMNSSLTTGSNNRYYIAEQRQLVNLTIDMGTGFIAVPNGLGIMTYEEQLTEDNAIKWAGVTYTIYKTQINSNIV